MSKKVNLKYAVQIKIRDNLWTDVTFHSTLTDAQSMCESLCNCPDIGTDMRIIVIKTRMKINE